MTGKKLFLIGLCFLLLTACSGRSAGNPVLATVNGDSVTLEDFRAQSAFMGLGGDPMLLIPEMRAQVLEAIIKRWLLLQEADKLKIQLSVTELNYHETMLRQGLEDNEFEKRLIEQGIIYEQWREILRQGILAHKSMEMLAAPKVHISSEEVKDYFEEHKEEFAQPEQVLAQHALFSSLPQARAVADLMRQGKDLRQAADEAKIHLNEETEPTWLSRGYIPESMEKVIFSLHPGEVAGPVRSDYGFHVVRVLAKNPPLDPDLAHAAEEIQRILSEEAKTKLAADLLSQLRSQAKVWMDSHFIESGQME
ncbi:MAG: peptidyl-prolyl cis-trans isomerase [Desulfarculales bacterium]|jgi:parvulin-like peptidyl-prolyl isomerase|nr:peptidyl-prolyl cis-trans isomerase [Desulfarculales bacterium]